MKTLKTNGFETTDGCLYRHQIDESMIDEVLALDKNRHLADLPLIPPRDTIIYVPAEKPKKRERISLWD